MSNLAATLSRIQEILERLQQAGAVSASPTAGADFGSALAKAVAASSFADQHLARPPAPLARVLPPGSELRRSLPESSSGAGQTTGRTPVGSGQQFGHLIERYAAEARIDPALVQAVMQAESNFNPRAISRAGAKGLMQLMDGTARGLGVTDPFDPEQNVRGGVKYLEDQLQSFGDVRLALAAYNAGPGAVRRFGGVPPYEETQTYVQTVMQNYERLRRR